MTNEEILITIQIALLALAPVALFIAWKIGVFRGEKFLQNAPSRQGKIAWEDLFIACACFLFGQLIPGVIVGSIYGFDESTSIPLGPKGLLGSLSFLSVIPLVLFIIIRSPDIFDHGLKTIGLSPSKLHHQLLDGIKAFLITFPIVFGLGAILQFIVKLAGEDPSSTSHALLHQIRETPAAFFITSVFIQAVITAPIIEELFFRGIIQTTLIQNRYIGKRWPAILITSILFTAIHYNSVYDANTGEFAWHTFPVLFVLSIGFGWAYEKTGFLYVPILMHALFNISQICLVLALPDC